MLQEVWLYRLDRSHDARTAVILGGAWLAVTVLFWSCYRLAAMKTYRRAGQRAVLGGLLLLLLLLTVWIAGGSAFEGESPGRPYEIVAILSVCLCAGTFLAAMILLPVTLASAARADSPRIRDTN